MLILAGDMVFDKKDDSAAKAQTVQNNSTGSDYISQLEQKTEDLFNHRLKALEVLM